MAMLAARFRSLVILLLSCAVFVSMTSALKGGAFVETPIRVIAGISQLIAVPILLVLASRDWLANQRKNLARWRNGLGLSSIAVLSTIWIFFYGVILLSWLAPQLARRIDGIEWLALSLLSSILSFALAFALRGAARVYAMSSALLVIAGVQSSIYV